MRESQCQSPTVADFERCLAGSLSLAEATSARRAAPRELACNGEGGSPRPFDLNAAVAASNCMATLTQSGTRLCWQASTSPCARLGFYTATPL